MAKRKVDLSKLGFNGNRLSVSPFEEVALKQFLEEIDFDRYKFANLKTHVWAGCIGINASSFINHKDHTEITELKLSKREQKIIFSIIQWMGSPVGRCFTTNLKEAISQKSEKLDLEKKKNQKFIQNFYGAK